MGFAEAFLPEFDQEMGGTRRALERVPEERLSWRPHERSGSLAWLAGHIANLPGWAAILLEGDHFDVGAPQGPRPEEPRRTAAILDAFDGNVRRARDLIAGSPPARFDEPWSLRKGAETLFTLTKAAALRSFVLNHMIHHRGQLTVYLRLTGTPVPSLYGPTADESPF